MPDNYRHFRTYHDHGASNSHLDNTRPSLQDNYYLNRTNQHPPKSSSKARPDAVTDNLENIDLEKTSKLNNKLKDLVSDFKKAAPLSQTKNPNDQNPRFFHTNEEIYNSSIQKTAPPYKNPPFNPNEYNMNNTTGAIGRYPPAPTGYSHTKTANKKSYSYEHLKNGNTPFKNNYMAESLPIPYGGGRGNDDTQRNLISY